MMRTIILCFIFFSSSLLGQTEKKFIVGLGSGFGFKTPYGGWGGFYTMKLGRTKPVFEINLGAGYKSTLVMGGGVGFRIYNNKKKIEVLLEESYSYCNPGQLSYNDETQQEVYEIESSQYFHSALKGRYIFTPHAALQLKAGYTFLLNSPQINHTFGPVTMYSSVQRLLSSGPLLSIDLVVYFSPRKLSD